MMLDTKHTFDELIGRYAPPTIRSRKRYSTTASTRTFPRPWLVPTSTLPWRSSIRFTWVDAMTSLFWIRPPHVMPWIFWKRRTGCAPFLTEVSASRFLKPYLTMSKVGLNIFNRSASTVLKLVERVTGAEFLSDVSEFMTGLADAFDIFRSRAEEVTRILQGEGTAFLLVTGTDLTSPRGSGLFLRATPGWGHAVRWNYCQPRAHARR